MSDKENSKLDELDEKVRDISLALQGDTRLGIRGLVPMLEEHIEQSAKNSEDLKDTLHKFKTDVASTYASNLSSLNENYFAYRREVDGKIEKIEDRTKNYGWWFGVVGGVAFIAGVIIDYVL